MGLQQLANNDTAEHRAQRVADGHEGDAGIATPGVGKFSRHGIYGGQNTADPQPGQHAPDRQIIDAGGIGRHEHADSHQDQATQYRGPAADPVGEAAQED